MLTVGMFKHSQSGFWHLDIPAELSPTGRRYRPSTKTKNKKIAEKIRAQVEEGKLELLLGARSAVPRQDFIDSYLEYQKPRLAETSYVLYKEIITRVLKACPWPPTPTDLQRYWQARLDAEKNRIKPITANKERRTVGAALSWGVKNELLARNPIDQVPKWNVKKMASIEWYEIEEVEKITAGLHAPYVPIVWWALATGMRLSEILAIRWKDVRSPRLGIVGKGNKVRYIPITDRMREILDEVRRGLDEDPDLQDLVFPFRRANVGVAFAKARDRAKIRKGHFHALRDTFAVWYLRNNGSFHILSKILGHSSVVITEKYYAHVPIGDISDEMERVSMHIWEGSTDRKERAGWNQHS